MHLMESSTETRSFVKNPIRKVAKLTFTTFTVVVIACYCCGARTGGLCSHDPGNQKPVPPIFSFLLSRILLL